MMKSYLFIPANKERYLMKSKELTNLDYRVFDLEESVSSKDINNSLKLLTTVSIKNEDWLRVPLNIDILSKVIEQSTKIGINNFVIPKFNGIEEFQNIKDKVLSINKNARFILLIETAKSFIDLENIIKIDGNLIEGISLGEQDFAFSTGVNVQSEYLKSIKMKIMLIAKAYDIVPIGGVPIDIYDENNISKGIIDDNHMGYRAKFFIHPRQLEILERTAFYSREEIEHYERVMRYIESKKEKDIRVVLFEGRIYEEMHIKKMKEILNWGSQFYGTIR